MLNDLKDLNISYPFMPVASMPEFFGNVKNMRVLIELPAMQPVDNGKNGDFITAILKGFHNADGDKARVHIVCASYGYAEDIEVPVFYGTLPTGNSWLYTDGPVPMTLDMNYRIHPSCLIFQQLAPVLHLEMPSSGLPPVDVKLEDDDVLSPYMLDTDLFTWDDWLELVNGNNVEVSGSSDSVVFMGAAGIGRGTFPVSPYTTDSSVNGRRGVGLRSINGLAGNVLIQPDRSVDIREDELAVGGSTIGVVYVRDVIQE